MEGEIMCPDVAEVAILVVGYRNAADIVGCLAALSEAAISPRFDVFICENGGRDPFLQLVEQLTAARICERSSKPCDLNHEFAEVECLRLRARAAKVWVARAHSNLGYAGGINAWLRPLTLVAGWNGIWVLNPDTVPQPNALAELVERAEGGGKAMVGSTILEAGEDSRVRFRGGLRWQTSLARVVAIGLGDSLSAAHDPSAIEAVMDSPSGASMYVTRSCVEHIGLMDDAYFLFYEDIDWGVRAKPLGLGYASNSVVGHKRGTTTGSSGTLKSVSGLSVYLEHRNGIRFVRRHFPHTVWLRLAISCCYALRFLLAGSPRNFGFVISGLVAGLRGETGRPKWHSEPG
ncbi:glycosyltransferase family 2 protein [Rhodopseudomonas sp. P2A-2r]|uniref:glycosyltransferase family 2 protein n=1 Tax=Rhodopseudomonas sp. P2A-2r TaxID=2991972 RepID=UPI002234E243|nr:glycosyltransferase family 2 protein [Rhodopseudomonas sp. P2A-2r]UZE48031.1 glycosyltransferase family 2 protein [Rhodopseudomonas sp. P2A-2r]